MQRLIKKDALIIYIVLKVQPIRKKKIAFYIT